MTDYRGKVAVVTGASSGLGRQLALDLAHKGAVVTGIARRVDLLAALQSELQARTPASDVVVCDVADDATYRGVLEDVTERHGRIDLLVQSAGVEQRVDALDADLDLYRRIMATNFFAAVNGTLTVLTGMVQRRSGYVLNVSSDHGRAPGPHTAAYCASKAALSAFTEAVAYEVRSRGVHLHTLYPGWVPTALGQGAVDQGMPMPPRNVHRTPEQVSKLALDHLGKPLVEINAARIAKLAPVARALFPRFYERKMIEVGG